MRQSMFIIMVVLLVEFSECFGQVNNNYLHTRNLIDRLGTRDYGIGSSSVPTLPMAPPYVKGDVYLTATYNLSVFELFNSEKPIEGYYSRLDLQKNEFDLITKQGVRVLSGSRVMSFAYIDSITQAKKVFINARPWKDPDGTPLDGFFEILTDGSLLLVKQTELIFKKADYHPALAVGSRDHKYIKKDHYFFVQDSIVSKLPGKKDIPKIFKGKEVEIEAFIKKNALSSNKESDLIIIFNYYYSI